jgi:hypothetical protein
MMDYPTVRRIQSMIDARRERLDGEWEKLVRGSRESGEVLAQTQALTELKWAIQDVFEDDYRRRHGEQWIPPAS